MKRLVAPTVTTDVVVQPDIKMKIKDILASNNVAEHLGDDQLQKIGMDVVHNFEVDKQSRIDWEKRIEDSMELALQVVKKKSFPWPNASNIKFPLITIAALQFHSRAYPALLPGTDVVKCRPLRDDADGELIKICDRISSHMSYQVLEEDEGWEDNMDRVLITQPIIGCAFKKSYYDPFLKHNVSENILAKDLVVHYFTKSLDTAQRISHVIYQSKNDVYERVARGLYLDVLSGDEAKGTQDSLTISRDKSQGVHEPEQDSDKPYEMIEHHCWLDLDGDGYEEPYIVVVHRDSKKVLRIVARFFVDSVELDKKGKVVRITPECYFTKYPFIPSPDGGFYDLGFGSLLGPLNESINTAINQIVDAATLSNTGGGFLSRGVKFRGGALSFAPGEWKQVDSTGDDLSKGIVPLPIREPSQVLYNLLTLLINYGERIGGAIDILVGENPGQNTPAATSQTMVEQGMKIFNGIYKRTYRSMKSEFRKLFRLNQLYYDGEGIAEPEDYTVSVKSIRPAADPNMTTDSAAVAQSGQLLSIANPNMYNMYEVHKRALKAFKVADIEQVLPDPKGPNALPPPPPPEKVQEAQVKAEVKKLDIDTKFKSQLMSIMQEAEVNKAKIAHLEAQALLFEAQAAGVADGHQIAKIQMQLEAAKTHHEAVMQSAQMAHDMMMKEMEASQPQQGSAE